MNFRIYLVKSSHTWGILFYANNILLGRSKGLSHPIYIFIFIIIIMFLKFSIFSKNLYFFKL